MKYFNVNYDKLRNLRQIKLNHFFIIFVLSFLILIVISINTYKLKIITLYGIYNDNILTIKINKKLSDIFKNCEYIEFNNEKINYELFEYGNYEIIDNEIYQELKITVDETFLNNDIGIVKIHYDKKRLIMYILDLFK